MSQGWTDSKIFKRTVSALRSENDRDFERAVLPLVRIMWPNAVAIRGMNAIDQKGIDIAEFSAAEFSVVIQCKGFRVIHLGADQAAQCIDSIETFLASDARADTYLLIHNRPGPFEDFRQRVQARLENIVAQGRARRAELWDASLLVQHAMQALFERVFEFARTRSLAHAGILREQAGYAEAPVTEVPFASAVLAADQHRLAAASNEERTVADPAAAVVGAQERLRVLLAPAGFGKTTTALRAIEGAGGLALYIPATLLTDATPAVTALIASVVELDEFLDEDRAVIEPLLRPVVKHLLKQRDLPVVVLLDGLDESIRLTRRGGMQWLFGQLRDIEVPIVLGCRSEFWRDRLVDFRISLGEPAASGTKRVQKIRTVELLPWEAEQIAALATRFAGRTTDADARARLERFAQDAGVDVIRLFGDVPRTPLFLRLILETLESGDVLTWSRSAVLEQWARIKIERDVRAPLDWDGPGRRHLVSADESVDTVVEMSFIAMEEAARTMVEVVDGAVELTPSCLLEALRTTAPRLVDILAEPTPLFLHSLLIQAPPSPSGERRIQFTHRMFQEFFLARWTTRPEHLIHGELPPAVVALREQIVVRSSTRVP